ncbi:hypothetical protein NDN08_000149 [Rhodosorus marinus]|uniref:Peptidyl-prolyl cis-trans isomerase n=1 Tax=Rhodosorus marinus TaxID=101924 RepID=A0AAV8UEC9_9RHOD|nr:hypothetical protein NDN08_000149 [Rhodosorus marinus]
MELRNQIGRLLKKQRVRQTVAGSVLAFVLACIGLLTILPTLFSETPRGTEKLSTPTRKCVQMMDDPTLKWDTPVCITNTVWMDIKADDELLGRLEVGLFGEVVPLSAENFLQFVKCPFGPKRCLRKDGFHRLVKNFVIQGGHSATGHSFINNSTFREERSADHHSFISHGRKGLLAWAEYPIGSQFYVTLCCEGKGPQYLDGNHVVFGTLLGRASYDTLDKMKDLDVEKEKPVKTVVVDDVGILA